MKCFQIRQCQPNQRVSSRINTKKMYGLFGLNYYILVEMCDVMPVTDGWTNKRTAEESRKYSSSLVDQ